MTSNPLLINYRKNHFNYKNNFYYIKNLSIYRDNYHIKRLLTSILYLRGYTANNINYVYYLPNLYIAAYSYVCSIRFNFSSVNHLCTFCVLLIFCF